MMMTIMIEIGITPSVVLTEIFLAYLVSCFVWAEKFHSLYTAVCDGCVLGPAEDGSTLWSCVLWPFGCVSH
jgi:hypothetical protein